MEQVTRATMPQETWGDIADEDWGNLDWGSWDVTEQTEKPQTGQRRVGRQESVEEKLKRMEEELTAYRQQLFMQQLANAISSRISGILQQNPELELWEEELRTRTWAKLVEWVSKEVANAGNDPKKVAEIYDINKLADKAMEIFSSEVDALKAKLEKVKGVTTQAPTSLPPTSASPPTVSTPQENIPGQRIPIYEDEENALDLYIVPETYIDKVRQRQRREWLQERAKLDAKRKRALEIMQRAMLEGKV